VDEQVKNLDQHQKKSKQEYSGITEARGIKGGVSKTGGGKGKKLLYAKKKVLKTTLGGTSRMRPKQIFCKSTPGGGVEPVVGESGKRIKKW